MLAVVRWQPRLSKSCISTVEDLGALLHADEKGEWFHQVMSARQVRAFVTGGAMVRVV
jgi:hypothetical protein